jgi:hypothetical protein
MLNFQQRKQSQRLYQAGVQPQGRNPAAMAEHASAVRRSIVD